MRRLRRETRSILTQRWCETLAGRLRKLKAKTRRGVPADQPRTICPNSTGCVTNGLSTPTA